MSPRAVPTVHAPPRPDLPDRFRFETADVRRLSARGKPFLYLANSSALVGLDAAAGAALDALEGGLRAREELAGALAPRFSREEAADALAELLAFGAIAPEGEPPPSFPKAPPESFPLATVVLNVTNRCNLACKYCYEFGEDRLASLAKAKAMSDEVARRAVDLLLEKSGPRRQVTVTFFGGETLLNFDVVRRTVAYARARGREVGKAVDFSLTTNATLLTDEAIEFLAENRMGVSVSIDGPRELHDRMRVDHAGRGSYDRLIGKVRALLSRHRSRPIGARVTLTAEVSDVGGIYRHLFDEVGFAEVGFAPVTSAPGRPYALEGEALARLLDAFTALAGEYRDAALRGEKHGFANLSDLLTEIHRGVAKSHPCGAGLGLLGVAPDGTVALCHRFAESEKHTLGDVFRGIDDRARFDFLARAGVADKPVCLQCWARGLCAGGCYHEAMVRYGEASRANLHYCDWIRAWTDLGLRTYAEIEDGNPSFFDALEARKA